MEKAIRSVISSGITVVISAGNEGNNASWCSPANVAEGITVGAVDKFGWRSVWDTNNVNVSSNFGSSVDIIAPGTSVPATKWYGNMNNKQFVPGFFNGTSAAAPLVTGVVAQYLQANPNATSEQVQSWIKNNATQGIVSGFTTDTPNRFLFSY
ncbi:S8 family serine peptidase [Armatimonas sp.]|uniref:S8 family serine peptidase n=1 Tax=Armatimonas sp. TaxID=1872638 RepID=UPI0037531DFF